MEIINDIQIEVTQIIIFKHSLMNKREVFSLKRLLFLANIDDVLEYKYLTNNSFMNCSAIVMKSGEWIKCKEDYSDLKDVIKLWYEKANENKD
jgi:hypothetical protein